MNMTIKNISSLEKVRNVDIMNSLEETNSAKVLAGENYSYQVCVTTETRVDSFVYVDSPLSEYIKVYCVKNAVADRIKPHDEDTIMTEPGLVPDILVPLEYQNGRMVFFDDVTSVWLDVQVPKNFPAGIYPVTLRIESILEDARQTKTFNIEVLSANIPEQSTIFTQWFYADCIADVHGVEIYSEEHWVLIEKYARLAKELGINMLLTPIITPPLDTDPGIKRPCTQLLKIEKRDDQYFFDFSLLDKWVDMAKRCGFEYFEIAHLFSQWGIEFTPNIKVIENGVEYYKFDSQLVKSTDPEYKKFLDQLFPELIRYLKIKGIYDKCYFHVSDEPNETHLEAYKFARDLIASHIGDERIMDAMSHVEYFKNGLTKLPVVGIDFMEDFLPENIENRWGYYCSSQWKEVSNRFLAMPSYRTRIIGLQMYKFNLVGFLHWGYNYYNSQNSRYNINPYMTSSCDKIFEAGDAFTVYPMFDGPIPSIRGLVFKEALQDVEVCKKLESYIGREAVIKMIDEEAGMDLTFKAYPRNSSYIPCLMEKMKTMIDEYNAK